MNLKNEEKLWMNQNLLTHKDTQYGTDTLLDIGICSSTGDYRNFASPALNIALVTFSTRKNQLFNIQNSTLIVKDVFELLHGAVADDTITYKIQSDKIFIIQKLNDKVFAIRIKSSENDIISIAIDYNILDIIYKLFQRFIDEYLNISINISSRFLLTEILAGTHGVKDSVLTIPSSIIDSVGSSGLVLNGSEPSTENVRQMAEMIGNFDEFLGEGMTNITIDIPNADKEVSKAVNEPTMIINKVFSSLRDFENFLFSVTTSNNTFKDITARIAPWFKSGNFLPGISIADIKSYMYISKSMYLFHMRQNIDEGVQIPISFPIMKYICNGFEEENILLAYDLLTISVYVRLFRGRMETKNSNSVENGSLMHLATRVFLDFLIYSFIENINKDMIISNVMERFKQLTSLKFFSEYELSMLRYNMSIEEKDLKLAVTDLCEKILGKSVPIGQLHEHFIKNENLNIPYDNPFTTDEINEKIIPLQLMIVNGKDVSKAIEEYSGSMGTGITEVLNTYFGLNSGDTKLKSRKESNILKAVNNFSDGISYKYRDQFIAKIANFKLESIEIEELGYPLEELGEMILKSIYVWNEYDKKISYPDFILKVESLTLNKYDIITKYKTVKESTQDATDENWFA